MIDKHKLDLIAKINQEYDLKYYLNNFQSIRKCVVIITDNQMAFLPAISEFNNSEHYVLVKNLLKTMNIDINVEYELFFISMIDNELWINLPIDKKVTLNQVTLLYKLLDQIEEYNNQENIIKAKVNCIDIPCDENINKIKKSILNYVADKKPLDNEIVIGRIPSQDDINKILEKISQNKNQDSIDSVRIK